MNFTEFGLDERIIEGIEAIGYKQATPIQEQAIPEILNGKDLIASAQTGTGKTAAFLLPILQKICTIKEDHHIKALVIVPTRELAIQIDQQLVGLGYFTPLSSIAVYGGSDGSTFSKEKIALTKGANIIICTPGRMLAHLKMNYVKFPKLEYLVLDEADRMLDMGFHDDIMEILSHLPKERQNLLFSATMPHKIRNLARKVLKDPVEINIAISKPPDKIVQVAFVIYENQKIPLVEYILKAKNLQSVIVFCSTKLSTKELGRYLKKAGFIVESIHSDLEQKEREEIMSKFRNRKISILVATDILSRGIDVEDIDLVINYDVPNDAEDYVHRVGRTARAASKGVAFTFINEKEQIRFKEIEDLLGKPVPKAKIPDDIGPGPAYDPKRKHRSKNGSNKKRRTGGKRR